ncbi:unnamed protein product (macronuclear) [Paramecium tetraurelia]|uniref:Uncharacterized protein n=1 Tax=Paramecium tetraurelia TaxID=5888 RepID=A0CP53_PARTE|nr:uncharacterized protein GSPATT00008961001 [Paramecium tetraurelia]CAK72570.1 unnamed protein product [Paramecium tetraurelia]|eukprot:XP_001439967.1 hypothetical protein (macronuclear) [Paramecium tetraurelia strain d4-2]
MQSSKVQVTFGSETLYYKLTDDPDDFIYAVCTTFKIKQFDAKYRLFSQQSRLEINKNQVQIFEFRNPNLIKKDVMFKIQQSGCKSIEIIEFNDKQNQFFEAFVRGNTIECCTRLDCKLCLGTGKAIIKESDQPFINEVVKNKLNERLPDISQIIQRRDQTKITSPEDFLKYHNSIKKCLKQEYLTITPDMIVIQNIQESDVIQQDDRYNHKYKVKIIEKSNFEGEVGGEAVMQLRYMNDGFHNWPQKVQLVCNEGPFQIRQDIKSAIKQQTINQEIKIHIPDIPQNQYEFQCRFEYQNEHNERIQFGPVIKLKLIVKDRNGKSTKHYNFDELNRKLIPEIKSQLVQMGYLNEININRIEAILQKSTYRMLTLEGFMNEFFLE